MHIISESVLMLLTKNYHDRSMTVEAIAGQSWDVFLRHSVDDQLFTDTQAMQWQNYLDYSN